VDGMKIGKKGDVDRYIVYTIVILILMALILILFFSGAYQMLKNLFFKGFLK
jgi:hypothetical protein